MRRKQGSPEAKTFNQEIFIVSEIFGARRCETSDIGDLKKTLRHGFLMYNYALYLSL